ncbi:hypothetical protein TSMEX_009698 [Taenia solium]|eukprot:TsM_000127600 transcript=TsM_000127600 gene=TsM_000127600
MCHLTLCIPIPCHDVTNTALRQPIRSHGVRESRGTSSARRICRCRCITSMVCPIKHRQEKRRFLRSTNKVI